MAIRFDRDTPGDWSAESVNRAKVDKGYGKRKGRIMFPTTHDITPEILQDCTTVLKKMLAAGNEVLIVSKPHPAVILELCRELRRWRKWIMFRFTIGSADEAVLSYWEPGAPSFHERLRCLAHAWDRGYQTSVSSEPMLDRNVEAVVEACAPFVTDSIWIGKANKLLLRMRRNGCTPEQLARGEELVAWQNDDAIKALYERLKDHSLVRWKESIKAVVGLDSPTEAGHDR
jgi:hypothetical protein